MISKAYQISTSFQSIVIYLGLYLHQDRKHIIESIVSCVSYENC